MTTTSALTQAGHRRRACSYRFRISKLAAALAASSLLASGSLHATLISDTDPGNESTNDSLAGATIGTLSDTFTGCVGSHCNFFVFERDEDFVEYTGLLAAATYSLTLTPLPMGAAFDFYGGDFVLDSSVPIGTLPTTITGITGFTSLFVGVKGAPANQTNQFDGVEGYQIALTKTADPPSSSVPEPATGALLLVGLLGAFVVRQRAVKSLVRLFREKSAPARRNATAPPRGARWMGG